MFENTTNFDFDYDNILDCFVPNGCSTQRTSSPKNPSSNGKNTQNIERIQCNKLNSNVSLKRKFPGPAGLLPDRSEAKKLFFDETNSKNITLTQFLSNESNLCSNDAWNNATDLFKTNTNISLINHFNISFIKKQLRANRLPSKKTPFLAVIIQNIEISDSEQPSINLTLKDDSDQIEGSLSFEIYEKYSDFISNGSVLVLQNLGVLSTGYESHYLVILPENVCYIFCEKNSVKNTEQDNLENNDNTNFVERIEIKSLDCDEIWTIYNKSREERHKVPGVPVNKNVVEKNTKNNVDLPFKKCSENVKTNKDDIKDSLKSINTENNVKNTKDKDEFKKLLDGVNLDDLFGDF